MSLSTLFKSNITVNARTSGEFLKLTKKCVERVQKMTSEGIMFTPPKFNYHQCKYLADKLTLVVESAETVPPKDITNFFEIMKLVHGIANVVENFTQSCGQDRWIQAAMTMTNLSERVSSLGFYLEAVSRCFLGVLTSTSFDGIYESEVQIVEEKASYDREALLKSLNALVQTKSTPRKVYQLATLLLHRLQHSQRHKNGSTPRFLQNGKNNLKEKEQLGRGSFATVFKASWLGIEVAKKTFYARDSPDFEKEVSILQSLSHPNITSLFGCAKDYQECSMIMELMDDDLFRLIRRRMKENKKRRYPFDIIEAMDMMLQIAGGMKYLYEMRIVHRDLKSLNILVKYVKARDKKIAYVLVKVCDFGLSTIKQNSLTHSIQTPNVGTARWMAPEMIKTPVAESSIEISNTDANDGKVAKHPFKSDVYSFAMVCYEILSGELPYCDEQNMNELKKKVLRGDRPPLPDHCPPDLKSLVEKCWNPDASKRPRFTEIFAELQQLQCVHLMSRMTLGPQGGLGRVLQQPLSSGRSALSDAPAPMMSGTEMRQLSSGPFLGFGGQRGDRRGGGMQQGAEEDRWIRQPGLVPSPGRNQPGDARMDMSMQGGFRPVQGMQPGLITQVPQQWPGQMNQGGFPGLIPRGPGNAPLPHFMTPGPPGRSPNGVAGDRWLRQPMAGGKGPGLIPSPRTPLPAIHKAESRYEVGKVSDEEQAKQRLVKGILNELTPQNFDKLFVQVQEANIDSATTLVGVISQIFDKALMEPTFCEMYAQFSVKLAADLPEFTENDEKITFRRVLLNKCQEEFERREREQEEAEKDEEAHVEVKMTAEEREDKRLKALRRMLGNIRFIGELYKKSMLAERVMHECIKKLLGEYQNPDEEDVEALCELMSTIGRIIDHPKAKDYIDVYFRRMESLSNYMKLSSRLRFMLKDCIELRRNDWQERRKVARRRSTRFTEMPSTNGSKLRVGRIAWDAVAKSTQELRVL